jgi:anaerobic magnesium-protoporphyrin IX monomethyl ester cyclase
MKVLLIKPDNLADHIQPSLGLGFLATQIRRDHDVVIHDCIKDKTPVEDIYKIIELHNPDVIGVQCYTFDTPKVHRMFKVIKTNFPEKITVVGGAHISSIPEEAFNQFHPFVDYAFNSESEIGFPKFLDALERKQKKFPHVEGLIWRDPGGKIVCNPPAFVQELDALGFPAWDLMPPETYPESQHGAFFKKFPIAPIITTRGCPYACTFCSAPILSGKKLRHHSVDYIQKHIIMLYKRGVREFHIVDDNFTFDMDFCKDALKGIIDLNLDISLALPNGIRMDRLDDEILELMKEAGVYLITVAVESGSDRILKRMKKATTVALMRKNIGMIKKHGFPVAGFFILGYPTETRKEMEATIALSKSLGLMRANFFTYLPLPGTESYNQLVESKEIDRVDWNNFLFMTAPYIPNGITRKELLDLKRNAFLTFHLNPKVFWANITAIKSFNHFKFLLRRFYHWVLMSPKEITA